MWREWPNECVCSGRTRNIRRVAISSDLKEKMRFRCDDLSKLRIISAHFPNTVLAVKTNRQLLAIKNRLLEKFNTTLNPSPMNCNPMNIKLQDNAIPIWVTRARRVPKHFEPESKKTIQELIDRHIITPVDE